MKLSRTKKNKTPVRQRQRELTRAPSTYSYSAQRASRPQSPERQQTKTAAQRSKLLSVRYWLKRSGTIAVILVVIVCAVSLLTLSSSPRVVLLDEGNAYAFRNTELYQEVAEAHLQTSVWNRNKLTVDTGAAAETLMNQFPEISDVSITLPLVGNRPIYYLQANSPAFVIQSVNGTFVLDASGTSLIARDGVPEGVVNSLPVITDQSGNRAESGKQAISRTNAAFIQSVIDTLAAKNIIVESLVLPAAHVQQLDVRISGKPYVIKFDMNGSGGVRQQVGSYLALAKILEAENKTPSQYIDVRVLGRAYYL